MTDEKPGTPLDQCFLRLEQRVARLERSVWLGVRIASMWAQNEEAAELGYPAKYPRGAFVKLLDSALPDFRALHDQLEEQSKT